jgi:kynurenine formamidase
VPGYLLPRGDPDIVESRDVLEELAKGDYPPGLPMTLQWSPTDIVFVGAPPALVGGSASPCRVIALVL